MTAPADGRLLFHDTIFAFSSGATPSAIAVVRVSGSATRAVLRSMTGRLPEPRQARLCDIKSPAGDMLDRGLVLFFPAPNSFTGEDCAEFHLHGGRAVVSAVLACLGELKSLRPAEAGEFTRRAFINGKVDLAQAEALSDLIGAETEAQRRFAISNGAGRQRALYEDWRRRLIGLQARIEADLDFSDQDDVPDTLASIVRRDAGDLVHEIRAHIASYGRSEIIRHGFQVVILGAPNAGKSSLLNALARREVAIVTEEAGTTRDIIEVSLDIDGIKVVVSDTAGLRDEPGQVEAIGIDRALDRAKNADLVLLLEDMAERAAVRLPADLPVVRVGNKSDLVRERPDVYEKGLAVSALDGAGLGELLSFLGGEASAAAGLARDVIPFRERHVHLLCDAAAHLATVADFDGGELELAAESLRLASSAIGRISGVIGTEDVLDAVFAEFCIGK